MMRKYELEVYVTEEGYEPFTEWLNGLKDKRVQAKLAARLRRAAFGNFGDFKTIKGAKRLLEMREHSGSGYRIRGNKLILLLAGSSKKDQNRTIVKAKAYLADYERKNNE